MDPNDIPYLIVGLCIIALPVAAFYALKVWFLLTLRNALRACHPDNRRMEPNQVWLELIPVFGYFWHFAVIHALESSLAAEYRDRDLDGGPFGRRIGWRAQIYLLFLPFPGVNVVAGILFAVFAISYWVLIAHHARTLRRHDEQRATYRKVLRAILVG